MNGRKKFDQLFPLFGRFPKKALHSCTALLHIAIRRSSTLAFLLILITCKFDTSVSLGIPTNLNPVSGFSTTDTKPLFRWYTVGGANKYQIQIANSRENLNSSPLVDTEVFGTSYRPAKPMNRGVYVWRIRALDGFGQGGTWSQVSTLSVGITVAPSITETIAGTGKVTLAWTAPSGNDDLAITGYNVYWSPVSGTGIGGTKMSVGKNTSVDVTGLSNGTTYYFVVTAPNLTGESNASSEVSATPTQAITAVTGVTIDDKTTTSVKVGDTLQLGATVSPADASNKAVTWSSSATGKATVDANGLVTGVAEGTGVLITVTTDDGSHTDTLQISVDKKTGSATITYGTKTASQTHGTATSIAKPSVTAGGSVGAQTFEIVGTVPAGIMVGAGGAVAVANNVGTGTYTFKVKVTVAADANYTEATATSKDLTVTISKAAGTATITYGTKTATQTYGTATNIAAPTVTADSGGAQTFAIVGTVPAGIMVDAGGAVAVANNVGTGTYTFKVKVTVVADANYTEATATSADLTVTISKVAGTATITYGTKTVIQTSGRATSIAKPTITNANSSGTQTFTIIDQNPTTGFPTGITVGNDGAVSVANTVSAGTYKFKVKLSVAADNTYTEATATSGELSIVLLNNIATDSTASGIMGIHNGTDLATHGTNYFQNIRTFQLSHLNDGDLGTMVDNWNDTTRLNLDYGFVGITWSTAIADDVRFIKVIFNAYSDGGWFGGDANTPINAIAPTLQITTDGTTWSDVAETNDYVSKLNGLDNSTPIGQLPTVTFTLDTPVTNITGIRLIGNEGGKAGLDIKGFIAVREFEVL